MWNSLRTRLTIILVGLAIAPLLLAGVILGQQSFTLEQRVAYDLQTQVAQNVSSEVEALLQSLVNELSTVGGEIRDPEEADRAQQLSILLSALSTGPYRDIFEELILLNNNGVEQVRLSRNEITPQNELKSHSGKPDFDVPRSTRSPYFSPVSFDKTSGKPYITIAIPLYEPRSVQLNAVLVARVDFETVTNLLGRIRAGDDQTIYLTDANGNLVAHQKRSINLQDSRIELSSQPRIQRGLDGSNVVIATQTIELGEQSFRVVAEKPVSKALALARSTIFTIAIVFAAAILLAVSVGFQAIRQIVRPVEELASTAERITAGDLSQRAIIKRRDEIGALGIAFNEMTTQLQDLISNLEQRVTERTAELEQSSLKIEKRASQLEAVAGLARSIVTLSDVDHLLRDITRMISARFGFYHVGIFLTDESKEYAVLRAANSAGGQIMLARHHRLHVGSEGLVGYATGQRQARIALDVGEDAVFFDNPDLPATRSEIALPLVIGGEVIGALDVQSEQSNAFSTEDIQVLSTLADQVAVAIQNARLFEQSQQATNELENALQTYIRREWSHFSSTSKLKGYRASKDGLKPITLEDQAYKKQNEEGFLYKAPISLRGVSIGTLDINLGKTPNEYTEEEIDIIQAVTDRIALALESARLLEESQKRASKEQTIGEISTKIGSSINLRNVLQTAVEELGHNIPGAEIVIELASRQEGTSGYISGEIE
jgi:GAF domain-containing protein/HAMP domain-containing protein